LNAILALECACVGDAGVDRVRAEIANCLPDTKVVEFGTKVLARNEARARVKQEAVQAVEREKQDQQTLMAERERVASAVVPSVFLVCGVWVLLLALINARGRRSEVAILRALGYGASQILTLFLFRFLVGGIVGGVIGCSISLASARFLRGNLGVPLLGPVGILPWYLVGMTIVIASLLSVAAGWIPALLAARQDPAKTLRETEPC
jgi:ABC-type antimicrobial peptide transport system permease subunit